MNIQLLFNTAELSWSHTLFSGIIGALIGGLVSGGITFFAMRVIDNQNKQRWEQDTFQKKKLDLILSTISLLADMLIYVNNTRKYIKIKDEPDLHTSFVKESERYKELYTHLSKLSIFYGDYYIFESIVLELKKLIYLSTGIETIFTNKTDSGYFELYEKGILSILHNQPYINYYQYLEYRQEEPFIIDNQVIMKGYKNAEEFSNSITVLLVLMKNLYDQLLKKVPQDKL